MNSQRIIPILTFDCRDLVKTTRFKNASYIGDTVNAVSLFSGLCADEIILLDIGKTDYNSTIDFKFLEQCSVEASVPLSYGGKIASVKDVERILRIGFEKVVINSAAINNIELLPQLAHTFGGQSISLSINYSHTIFKKFAVYDHVRKKNAGVSIDELLNAAVEFELGEVLLSNYYKDGTLSGHDREVNTILKKYSELNFVINGGVSSYKEVFSMLKQYPCASVGCGALFVYQGPYRSVLINYPSQEEQQANGKML